MIPSNPPSPAHRTRQSHRRRAFLAAAVTMGTLTIAAGTSGGQTAFASSSVDIIAPGGSTNFGYDLTVLANGNFVVVDSESSIHAPSAGAVLLYSGTTHALISTLTGQVALDRIGSDGVVELTNGDFVVLSGDWHNGAAGHAGAVTWVDGATGLTGTVNAANSLVGSQIGDSVGDTTVDEAPVIALTNGNYVVTASDWSNGAVPEVGAAAWGNGEGGTVGAITTANSLYGAIAYDHIGSNGTVALSNGNYVVDSADADNGALVDAGAVTWGSGAAGTTGAVGPTNSLHGDAANQRVGSHAVTALTNGNYVVDSDQWSNGTKVGAVTWASGAGPTTAAVSLANSLHGSTADDLLDSRVWALANGNYAVTAPDHGPLDTGAVTWGDGTVGTTGAISAANSLVGSHPNDVVGNIGLTPLTNGNYVVASSGWDDGTHMDPGAATWVSGTSPAPVGAVSAANSLVGSHDNDNVSSTHVVALTNGNYVVASEYWNDARGAATFGSGLTGTVGVVGPTNSLLGSTPGDDVSGHGTLALTNGNYVVLSPRWANGAATSAGAVTFANGASGVVGLVTSANSLVGTSTSDMIGDRGVALDDGNYVVGSQLWSNGAVPQVGAATWGNGATGITGPVTTANSLVGSKAADHIGDYDLVAIEHGRYAVESVSWDNGSVIDAGATTIGGPGGVVGTIDATKGHVGSITNDLGHADARLIADGSVAIGRPAVLRVTLFHDDYPSGDYLPLTPARLADTRPGHTTVDGLFAAGGVRPAGSVLELSVAGRGGVPADAVAVTLNVTATEASAAGFVTVYPCGSPQPTASNLNAVVGATTPNAVVTKIGSGGTVCIFTQQALHLVVDVDGAFPPTTSYVAINPARLLDTRTGRTTIDGQQQGTGAVTAGSVTTLHIAGRAGVPADAGSVVLNVTVTEPTTDGYATVYPCGATPPTASNLNYVPGQTTPNLVVAKIGSGGSVCIFSQSESHLVTDVLGYFPAATSFTALVPARLLETREGFVTVDGQGAGAGVRPLGTITKVHVTGRGGVPMNAATAVLNVTVTKPEAEGFVTVFPCGIDAPLASNLNFEPGQTTPNAVIAKIGAGGDVCIVNSQSTHLIVDVTGFFP